jgi:hypothetical protein
MNAIISGIIVLIVGFIIFYFFMEFYIRKKVMRPNNELEINLKKLVDLLPMLDDIMNSRILLDIPDDYVPLMTDEDRLQLQSIQSEFMEVNPDPDIEIVGKDILFSLPMLPEDVDGNNDDESLPSIENLPELENL